MASFAARLHCPGGCSSRRARFRQSRRHTAKPSLSRATQRRLRGEGGWGYGAYTHHHGAKVVEQQLPADAVGVACDRHGRRRRRATSHSSLQRRVLRHRVAAPCGGVHPRHRLGGRCATTRVWVRCACALRGGAGACAWSRLDCYAAEDSRATTGAWVAAWNRLGEQSGERRGHSMHAMELQLEDAPPHEQKPMHALETRAQHECIYPLNFTQRVSGGTSSKPRTPC